MGRLVFLLLVVIAGMAAVIATVFLMPNSGSVTLTYGNTEVSTYAAVLVAMVFLMSVAGALLIWILGLPSRWMRGRRRRRREKGWESLERALVAMATGDGRGARREARKADTLLERSAAPSLIAAQAAQNMGDVIGAESQYAAMLSDGRTEVVGRRGLAEAALSRGDFETAIVHAREAFTARPDVRWAFDLLFGAQVRATRWEDALETLDLGAKNKHLPDKSVRRRRAVLLAAAGASHERDDLDRARDFAERAASTSPAFAPATALAARLLLMSGKSWRAASVVEEAWTAAPHPALSLAYKDLKPDEPADKRAKRLAGLIKLNPDHRESRILAAESALEEGDVAAAKEALTTVRDREGEPSARLCGLYARIAEADGRRNEARDWVRRIGIAPEEPDWSDLDPEGPAFAYTDEDWARLVYSYGDVGELIHPRHERYERARMTAPEHLLLESPDAAGSGPPAPPPRAGETPPKRNGAPEWAPGRVPDDPGPDGAPD